MKEPNTNQVYMYMAWVVSITAMLGSLYFSEIRGFIPCELCWYQRILMYPLVLILGIGTFQADLSVKRFVLPMAIIGWCISFYHYMLQKVPGLAEIKPCVNGVPCNAQYINWFDVITIPFLALTAFTIIIYLMIFIKTDKKAANH